MTTIDEARTTKPPKSNTAPPHNAPSTPQTDRLHKRLNRLQFWGDTTTRQLEKLAKHIAKQETK